MSLLDVMGGYMKMFSPTDVYTDISRHFRNVVGFYAVKTDAGATSLVVNTAFWLVKQGKSVLVVDLHLDAPTCFKYLAPTCFLLDFPVPKTLNDKLLNMGVSLREFAMDTKLRGAYLLTASPQEFATIYCSMNEVYLNNIFEEASEIYDYVLVDIHGDLAYETTTAALNSCDIIFSIITPQTACAELLQQHFEFTRGAGFGDKLGTRVIQNLVRDSTHDVSLLLKSYGMHPAMSIPYEDSLRSCGENYNIFYASNDGASIGTQKFMQCIDSIGKNIMSQGG